MGATLAFHAGERAAVLEGDGGGAQSARTRALSPYCSSVTGNGVAREVTLAEGSAAACIMPQTAPRRGPWPRPRAEALRGAPARPPR